MEAAPVYMGIDVSKAQWDVAERPSGERAVMPHTEERMTTLVERLHPHHPACLVLEATGGLDVPLASALAVVGIPVAVVTPGRCAILPTPPASWRKRMRSMHRPWPGLRKRSVPSHARCRMTPRRPSVRGSRGGDN